MRPRRLGYRYRLTAGGLEPLSGWNCNKNQPVPSSEDIGERMRSCILVGPMRVLVFAVTLALLTAGLVMFVSPTGATTGSWTTESPMPTARRGAAIVTIDVDSPIFYVVGGYKPGSGIVGTLEAYNPRANTWTTLTPMPNPRAHVAAVSYEGKIWAFGGLIWPDLNRYGNSDDDGEAGAGGSALVQVYDPEADSWSSGYTSMPTRRGGAFAAALHDGLHVFGGHCNWLYGQQGSCSRAEGVYDIHEVYDPLTDSWSTKSPLPSPIAFMSGVAYDGHEVQLFGGSVGTSIEAGPERRNYHFYYDSYTDSWDTLVPNNCDNAFSGTALIGNLVYIVGGPICANDNYSGSWVLTYNIETRTWGTAASIPTPRAGLVAATDGERIYAIGGTGLDNKANCCGLHYTKTEAFMPPAAQQSQPSDPPTDSDGDGVPNSTDNCPNHANSNQADSDGDGIGDTCESSPPVTDPSDGFEDSDGPDAAGGLQGRQGTPDQGEAATPVIGCPGALDRSDSDGDGVLDACDPTPNGPPNSIGVPAPGVAILLLCLAGAAACRRRF